MTFALWTIGIFSVSLNILLIWYVSKVLAKLLYTSDNLGDLYIIFHSYEKFVSGLYEMDMFYGEPILEELMKKTKLIREELERFEDIYSLTTDVEILEEEEIMDEHYIEEKANQEA